MQHLLLTDDLVCLHASVKVEVLQFKFPLGDFSRWWRERCRVTVTGLAAGPIEYFLDQRSMTPVLQRWSSISCRNTKHLVRIRCAGYNEDVRKCASVRADSHTHTQTFKLYPLLFGCAGCLRDNWHSTSCYCPAPIKETHTHAHTHRQQCSLAFVSPTLAHVM